MPQNYPCVNPLCGGAIILITSCRSSKNNLALVVREWRAFVPPFGHNEGTFLEELPATGRGFLMPRTLSIGISLLILGSIVYAIAGDELTYRFNTVRDAMSDWGAGSGNSDDPTLAVSWEANKEAIADAKDITLGGSPADEKTFYVRLSECGGVLALRDEILETAIPAGALLDDSEMVKAVRKGEKMMLDLSGSSAERDFIRDAATREIDAYRSDGRTYYYRPAGKALYEPIGLELTEQRGFVDYIEWRVTTESSMLGRTLLEELATGEIINDCEVFVN